MCTIVLYLYCIDPHEIILCFIELYYVFIVDMIRAVLLFVLYCCIVRCCTANIVLYTVLYLHCIVLHFLVFVVLGLLSCNVVSYELYAFY